MTRPVGVLEVFGLRPLVPALKQCWTAIAGGEHSAPTQFGLSSLSILKPRVAVPLWLGRRRADRRTLIYNLPNRTPRPLNAPYSVKAVQSRDFRGGRLTYDGHLGTDFAVRPGTRVTAAASGTVIAVQSDMQRGGLKVGIDHGRGLITSANHLSRALVTPGQRVRRGEVVGLSGMSGVDGILFFPWLAPHVHYNVSHNGLPVDPFAAPGEIALWRGDNDPTPHEGPPTDDAAEPTAWDAEAVQASLASCADPALRKRIERSPSPAAALAYARMYFGQSFAAFPPLADCPRAPFLSLPFHPDDIRGIAFPV